MHVALQVGRDPQGFVAGDACDARWESVLDVVDRDGVRDFRGPAVQGRPGERLLYLIWGDRDGPTFHMFRRAKIMLAAVPDLDARPSQAVATVELTDDGGGPRCGRLTPPALVWETTR